MISTIPVFVLLPDSVQRITWEWRPMLSFFERN